MAQQHRYQSCRDGDCDRPYCRVFKEGFADGWDVGREVGQAEGQAAGYDDGYAAATANCSCG